MKRINFVYIQICEASRQHHDITSTHRRQDLKPFRHLSSCNRPVVRVLPMSRCCWKHGGETSSISRSISAKAVFSELAWSNCWKETKLAWEFYHVQFIHHFRVMFMSFVVIFMFSFFFPCGSPEWSTSAISPRSQLTEPLATRLEEVTPSTNKSNRQTGFRFVFFCVFSSHFALFHTISTGFLLFFALFHTKNAR